MQRPISLENWREKERTRDNADTDVLCAGVTQDKPNNCVPFGGNICRS